MKTTEKPTLQDFHLEGVKYITPSNAFEALNHADTDYKNLRGNDMKTKYLRKLSLLLLMLAGLLTISFVQNPQVTKQNPSNERNKNTVKYKVTFIELGSVRC